MEIEFISNEGFVGQTQKQELDPEVQRGFFSDFICLLCSKERSRLLYTSCSHKLCENCKIDLFKAKQEQTINCPFCSEPLRKRDISEKSQEEQDFENEIRIREMLLLEFSEQREDFETEEQYNDYLELFEEVVLKKLRGDLQSLDEDIKEYRKMKTLRKRLRKDREKALANKGVTTLISLDKISYPKMINSARGAIDDGKKGGKGMLYKASGYNLEKCRGKSLKLYELFAKGPVPIR